jgi:DNA-binding response OmpR family regulator
MVMPHKGGIETLIELRSQNSSLKIIAITGKISTARDSVKGIASQFKIDAIFEKPFDMFDFTQKVEELLSE